MDKNVLYVEGKNPIIEYVNANNKINVLYIQNGIKFDKFDNIIDKLKKNNTIIKFVDKKILDNISISKKHKGLIAEIDAYKYANIEDILNKAKLKNKNNFIVILDEIEDPHNFGAIIRSCVAVGVDGIIIKNKNNCPVNTTVYTTSAGTVNSILISKVSNLNNTIEYLKKNNIWIYASDMNGNNMFEQDFDGNVALVIGNEGHGISKLVKENCDFIVSIPMVGKINSLNASCSAAIMLYQIFKYRM